MFKCNDCDAEAEDFKAALNHAHDEFGHSLTKDNGDETTMTVSLTYDDDDYYEDTDS